MHVIGLDVGGTKIAGGWVELPSGQVHGWRIFPTRPERGGRAVLDDTVRLARELAVEAAAAGHALECLGLGLCELIDRKGRPASANCISWIGQPVLEELSAVAPAFLEADVRAGALAESVLGAGRGVRNFLYITIGTGISCCLVLDGQPYQGARGAAGTMASGPIRVPCDRCGELSKLTLEELASGPALVARFNARGGQGTRGHDVLAAAVAGDPVAQGIVQTATQALGSQVAMLIGTLDPESLIVGGGLGLGGDVFWDRFVTATRQQIWSELQKGLPILRAATGPDAGWLGAAVAAFQKSGGTFPTDFAK